MENNCENRLHNTYNNIPISIKIQTWATNEHFLLHSHNDSSTTFVINLLTYFIYFYFQKSIKNQFILRKLQRLKFGEQHLFNEK